MRVKNAAIPLCFLVCLAMASSAAGNSVAIINCRGWEGASLSCDGEWDLQFEAKAYWGNFGKDGGNIETARELVLTDSPTVTLQTSASISEK